MAVGCVNGSPGRIEPARTFTHTQMTDGLAAWGTNEAKTANAESWGARVSPHLAHQTKPEFTMLGAYCNVERPGFLVHLVRRILMVS